MPATVIRPPDSGLSWINDYLRTLRGYFADLRVIVFYFTKFQEGERSSTKKNSRKAPKFQIFNFNFLINFSQTNAEDPQMSVEI